MYPIRCRTRPWWRAAEILALEFFVMWIFRYGFVASGRRPCLALPERSRFDPSHSRQSSDSPQRRCRRPPRLAIQLNSLSASVRFLDDRRGVAGLGELEAPGHRLLRVNSRKATSEIMMAYEERQDGTGARIDDRRASLVASQAVRSRRIRRSTCDGSLNDFEISPFRNCCRGRPPGFELIPNI